MAESAGNTAGSIGAGTGAAEQGSVLRGLLVLTKPGITRLVLVTTGVGFAIPALAHDWTLGSLAVAAVACLLGTALCSSGANAMNMSLEHRRDALMKRTCQRPIPTGHISPSLGWMFGVVCSIAGGALLAMLVNPAASAVALASVALYVIVYTPMKPLSPLSTIVGAFPGALPPLIGWVGASTGAGWDALAQTGGWSLVLIMVIWQMPHFHAIAWMYRDDYALGGHRVLAVLDETGERVATASLGWLMLLLPASLWPVFDPDLKASAVYFVVAVALWVVFLRKGARFRKNLDRDSARGMFLASIAYLPLLLLALVTDSLVRWLLA